MQEKLDESLLLGEYLQIMVGKYRFILQMENACHLPEHKSSALRGGMGEMLLQMNCIRDRKCDHCPYEEECIIRRIMYSKMRIRPDFMSAGDSVGYVIDCEDRREEFAAGDELVFDLLLFGRSQVYLGEILRAFKRLGRYGLGKDNAEYTIKSVRGYYGEWICEEGKIHPEKAFPLKIGEYVAGRKRKFRTQNSELRLRSATPLSLKFGGEIVKEFHADAILRACERRLYMLNCYEGIDCGRIETEEPWPEICSQKSEYTGVLRFSSTHGEKIRLEGVTGEAILRGVTEKQLELLFAGELIHVGKNSSFGFGRYSIAEKDMGEDDEI
ncbi:MAG: CRISPR system precrRNA processing endoribonuclease RAMP protein Cas6 [Lachnospiraceae bacterium]|nr:CRISPR system precrRNA processing endoribonuclease RAMP protein Cas6 [Lachnospiraceae bacterium]